jgi:hypothetical protein
MSSNRRSAHAIRTKPICADIHMCKGQCHVILLQTRWHVHRTTLKFQHMPCTALRTMPTTSIEHERGVMMCQVYRRFVTMIASSSDNCELGTCNDTIQLGYAAVECLCTVLCPLVLLHYRTRVRHKMKNILHDVQDPSMYDRRPAFVQ